MKFKILAIACFLIWTFFPSHSNALFIAKKEKLKTYYEMPDVVMIASTGRSASTMLTRQIKKYFFSHDKILKTHLLPPDPRFKGKIIFIFSNPDQAAESALHKIFERKSWGKRHFHHIETADHDWLKRIGGIDKQTEQENLLSYDALGTYEHLKAWLHNQTTPADPEHAQILAIKYENLWDRQTVQAIRNFLNIPRFRLPPKKPRRYTTEDELYPQEISFRKIYNLGTQDSPRYIAYDAARALWEQAPPFQYLVLSPNKLLVETP